MATNLVTLIESLREPLSRFYPGPMSFTISTMSQGFSVQCHPETSDPNWVQLSFDMDLLSEIPSIWSIGYVNLYAHTTLYAQHPLLGSLHVEVYLNRTPEIRSLDIPPSTGPEAPPPTIKPFRLHRHLLDLLAEQCVRVIDSPNPNGRCQILFGAFGADSVVSNPPSTGDIGGYVIAITPPIATHYVYFDLESLRESVHALWTIDPHRAARSGVSFRLQHPGLGGLPCIVNYYFEPNAELPQLLLDMEDTGPEPEPVVDTEPAPSAWERL